MRKLIKLRLTKSCGELHVNWYINAGEATRKRYEKLWAEVVQDMRQEAMTATAADPEKYERMRTMSFPTSSFEPMPK